jgi:hypothetical protein
MRLGACVDPRAGFRFNQRTDSFAPFARHRHVWMSGEHIFDITRINIEPAAHDHVLVAIKDVEVSFLIGTGDIARVKPAIPEQCLRVLRPFPVLASRMRRTHANLPWLIGRHLATGTLQEETSSGRGRSWSALRSTEMG